MFFPYASVSSPGKERSEQKSHKHTGMMQRAPAHARALSWLTQQGKNFFARKDYSSAIQSWLAARQQEDRPENLEKALAEAYFRQGQQILFQDPLKATEDLMQATRLADTD